MAKYSAFFLSICLVLLGTSYGATLPTLKLSSEHELPVIGFDIGGLPKGNVESLITLALNAGYRHFDSAYRSGHEKALGKALKKWFAQGGKREEVFITSKLPGRGLRPGDVSIFLDESLSNLGLDYVDLYTIHTPIGIIRTINFKAAYDSDASILLDPTTDHVAIWKEMEKQVKDGKAKSLGLSNFNRTQLMRIYDNAEIKPANLQIENNAYIQQTKLVELAHSKGIVVTSSSPTGSPLVNDKKINCEMKVLPELLENPLVKIVAEKYKKTPAQILVRFNLQRNIAVSVDSNDPAEIKQSINIFDFTLKEEDIKILKALDQNGKYRKLNMLYLKGVEDHPEYPWPELVESRVIIY